MDDYSAYYKHELHCIIYYCVNENITTIEEFVDIERKALKFANIKKHHLFTAVHTHSIGSTTIAKN